MPATILCEVNNLPKPPRNRRFLELSELERAVDEIGPFLERVQFYNYGEPFLHQGTVAMVRHIKDHHPHVWVDSSTNGHFFQDDRRRREVVESGIDRLIFSVDGATQESYERYRKGGDLARVLRAMEGIVGYRTMLGRSKPEVMWRYILFEWNDGFLEMRRARGLARKMGVDALCWHLSLPVPGASKKYAAGTRATRRIWQEFFDSGPWPNALRERRTSARPSLLRARIRASLPSRLDAGTRFALRARLTNTGDTRWLCAACPEGRFVTLGVDFFEPSGQILPGLTQRIHLPQDLPPRRTIHIEGEVRAPEAPGRYRLRLDLVNELHAWFGDLGSKPLLADVEVV